MPQPFPRLRYCSPHHRCQRKSRRQHRRLPLTPLANIQLQRKSPMGGGCDTKTPPSSDKSKLNYGLMLGLFPMMRPGTSVTWFSSLQVRRVTPLPGTPAPSRRSPPLPLPHKLFPAAHHGSGEGGRRWRRRLFVVASSSLCGATRALMCAS